MADVVLLSGASASVVSRLWSDDCWLDKVAGATLQNLVAVVPDLASYVSRRSRTRMIEGSLGQCADAGLNVSMLVLDAIARQPTAGLYVATALSAAASVMRQDRRLAYSRLTRSWGSAPDVALDALFASGPDAMLTDRDQFLARATQMVETEAKSGKNSLVDTVGAGILVHKLTKISGVSPIASISGVTQRSSAFEYRSSTIGAILAGADVDVSERYCADLVGNPLLQRNEIWSLATYSSDLDRSTDFSISTGTTFGRTVEMLLHDLGHENEVYVHYLTTTAIPAVLAQDREFGSARSTLVDKLKCRIDKGITDRRVRDVCTALLTATN